MFRFLPDRFALAFYTPSLAKIFLETSGSLYTRSRESRSSSGSDNSILQIQSVTFFSANGNRKVSCVRKSDRISLKVSIYDLKSVEKLLRRIKSFVYNIIRDKKKTLLPAGLIFNLY